MKLQEIKENILLVYELSVFVLFTLVSHCVEILKVIAFGKENK